MWGYTTDRYIHSWYACLYVCLSSCQAPVTAGMSHQRSSPLPRHPGPEGGRHCQRNQTTKRMMVHPAWRYHWGQTGPCPAPKPPLKEKQMGHCHRRSLLKRTEGPVCRPDPFLRELLPPLGLVHVRRKPCFGRALRPLFTTDFPRGQQWSYNKKTNGNQKRPEGPRDDKLRDQEHKWYSQDHYLAPSLVSPAEFGVS